MERINPPELGKPSGFSHAVVAEGRVVFLAGQTARDASNKIVGDGVVEQFERALGNLLASLRAAGGGPSDLCTVTISTVNMANSRAPAREIGRVWKRLAGTEYPAMAGIGVSR